MSADNTAAGEPDIREALARRISELEMQKQVDGRAARKQCARAGCANTDITCLTMRRCMRCRSVWYCCQACATEDESAHRSQCNIALKAVKAAAAATSMAATATAATSHTRPDDEDTGIIAPTDEQLGLHDFLQDYVMHVKNTPSLAAHLHASAYQRFASSFDEKTGKGKWLRGAWWINLQDQPNPVHSTEKPTVETCQGYYVPYNDPLLNLASPCGQAAGFAQKAQLLMARYAQRTSLS